MSYVGEFCPKCNKARLLHPQVYVYTCPFCRFSYQVNPVSRFKDIMILSKPNKQKQLKAKKERKAIDKANQQRWG